MSASNYTDPVRITFFPDFAAATKREEVVYLPDLADRIINTSASAKTALPWLKLATFGDLRSDKNSLRCNANVRTISGIEADPSPVMGNPRVRDRPLSARDQRALASCPDVHDHERVQT